VRRSDSLGLLPSQEQFKRAGAILEEWLSLLCCLVALLCANTRIVEPPDSWGVSPMELDIAVDYPIAIGMRREGLKDWRDGTVPQGVGRAIEVYYGPHEAVLEIVSNLSGMIPTQIPASSREYSP
jgi:hypothetical protein